MCEQPCNYHIVGRAQQNTPISTDTPKATDIRAQSPENPHLVQDREPTQIRYELVLTSFADGRFEWSITPTGGGVFSKSAVVYYLEHQHFLATQDWRLSCPTKGSQLSRNNENDYRFLPHSLTESELRVREDRVITFLIR